MKCFVCNKTIEEGANDLDIAPNGGIVHFVLCLSSTKRYVLDNPTEVFKFHLGCFAEASGWAKQLLKRFEEMKP